MKKLALRTGLDLLVTSKCFFFIELFFLYRIIFVDLGIYCIADLLTDQTRFIL